MTLDSCVIPMAAIRKRIVVIDGNITMDVTVYFGDMFSDISLAVMWLVTTLTEGQARVNTESSKILFMKGVKAYEQT